MNRLFRFRTGGALALITCVGAISASADQFTIGVIPDTQNYCDTIASESVKVNYSGHLVTMAANPQPRSAQIFVQEMTSLAAIPNLVFVTHVGDIVQHGDLYPGEWVNAVNAMTVLANAGIPFGMTPGNHDYDNYSHTTGNRPLVGNSQLIANFGPSSSFFSGKSWYGGSHTDTQGSGGLSSYQTFTAGGKTYLHINLAMEASDDSLTWAEGVVTSHPGMPTIVTTHEYLSYANDPVSGLPILLSDGYMLPVNGVTVGNNQAAAVWSKFISQYDQIFLVLCGHSWSTTAADGTSDGENVRIDFNAFGHPVYQVLSDFQGNVADPTTPGNIIAGGAGWVRLMTFDTVQNTIHFQTYNTLTGQYAANGAFDLPVATDNDMTDFTLPIPERPVTAPSWKFGVLSDTQWVLADDGKSPESTPASIIQQVDKVFIDQGVKLVVAVGDTVDNSTPASQATRALYSQDLYNAGIAFYPLRGNHDAELLASGNNFAVLYPQIVNGGFNNLTPNWDNPTYIINSLFSTTADAGYSDSPSVLTAAFTTGVPPALPAGSVFQAGHNFSYPTANAPLSASAGVANYPGASTFLGGIQNYPGNTPGNGLSYSFDYNNVRFILLDQFTDSSPGGNTSTIAAQQPWITQQLSDPARPAHVVAFSHKQILGGNHKDNLFGTTYGNDPGDGYGVTGLSTANKNLMNAKLAAEDAFITAMNQNGGKFLVCGHDHHHVNSLVKSPLSPNSIHELICQSDSNKFYTPGAPYSANEISISEDLWQVGCYIFTVSGPRFTVDYYAVPTYAAGASLPVTPVLTGNWEKALTFGYSLNGQEFQVAQKAAYTVVADNTSKAIANASAYGESGYVGTTLAILGGVNNSTLTTRDGRKLTKFVDTGWAPANGTISDIVTLWGLTDVSAIQTDTIAVSVSFDTSLYEVSALQDKAVCLGSRDLRTGVWINAVDSNIVGGTKHFVYGPYSAAYGLGYWGIDPVAGTAWAVVNGNNRDFAVIPTPTATLPWDLNGDGVVNTADLALLNTQISKHSTNPAYDLTGDGKVDVSDARWLSLHFTNVGGK